MTACFFYGTLRHAPLRDVVLGRSVDVQPALLPGHAVQTAAGESFPLLVPDPGAVAPGLLTEPLDDEALARLTFYEGGFSWDEAEVLRPGAPAGAAVAPARLLRPEPGLWQADGAWDLDAWAARWAETVMHAAMDFMALYGQAESEAILARYDQLLVRAGARARAAVPRPVTRRHKAAPGDVEVVGWQQPYAKFFALEEFQVNWRRFDGSRSATVPRAAFVSGDAVVVLPYDPVRDRVLLVEQFRVGPFVRGDSQPWQIETVAGRVDGGETPEEAALRETVEEAGLTLHRLVAGPSCYASTGAMTEYLYHYVGLADLPDGSARVAGLAEEAEDIRGHLMGFDEMMALIDTGEIDNAPLILIAYWLARERPRLRAEAGQG